MYGCYVLDLYTVALAIHCTVSSACDLLYMITRHHATIIVHHRCEYYYNMYVGLGDIILDMYGLQYSAYVAGLFCFSTVASYIQTEILLVSLKFLHILHIPRVAYTVCKNSTFVKL